MPNPLIAGVRRWVVSSVALPLGARTLDTIAGRLERAEGRSSVMSRGLRTASKVARRDKQHKGRDQASRGTER